MESFAPRWVLSKTTRNAHLDLGERSSQSLRVYSDHVIVTVCRAHLAQETAIVVRETHQPKCSNCQRIARQRLTPKLVPEIVKTPDPNASAFARPCNCLRRNPVWCGTSWAMATEWQPLGGWRGLISLVKNVGKVGLEPT
jgi:hypothetical protein